MARNLAGAHSFLKHIARNTLPSEGLSAKDMP
jgi:hypothetical protein